MEHLPTEVCCLIKWFFRGVVLTLGMAVVGCSQADTLGGEAPDEVVITGTPSWENGIKRLVGLKCATCHTVPANELTPNNAPDYLNLKEYSNSEDLLGAETLGVWINSGILEKDFGNVRQMPLEYATPLTQGEIDALQTWVDLGLPEN